MLFSSCTISFVLRLKAKKKRDFIIASYLLRGIVIKGGLLQEVAGVLQISLWGGAFQERGFHHIGDLFVKAGVQINFQRGQFRLNGSLL